MSRDIRFRAWDGVDYMSHPFTLYDVQSKRIEFAEDVVLMQFTGLKDRNGKEIYEGDVLGNGAGETAPVEYMRTREAQFEAQAPNAGDILCFTETDVEVIGNIYENPDLLEV